MMTPNRRWFLLLMGASATNVGARLWLPETGLIELPGRFAIELRGECSFCGKHAREVASLLGLRGRAQRVCDECIGLCMDILDPSGGLEPAPPGEDATLSEDLDAILAELEELERLNPELYAKVDEALDHTTAPAMPTFPPTNCSFCDAHHTEIGKLIAGPNDYICDVCVT